MKSLFFGAVSLLTCSVALGAAEVDRVLVRQQWPWSEKVAIDFVLTNVTSATEIRCAVSRGAAAVEVPEIAFTGDICELDKDGSYRIMFDPSYLSDRPAKGETLSFSLTPVEMTAESRLREVFYKIFDLQDKTVTDVTRGDLLSGKYGSIETDYSKIGEGYKTPLSDVLIWTGVTNYPGAKTTKLVMRKVPAGTFKFGKFHVWTQPTQYTITVSKPFYIGVFELTQKQFSFFKNATTVKTYNPGEVNGNLGDEKPVNTIDFTNEIYDDARVWDASTGALLNLKNMFAPHGTYHFDIPTQAMWFRALRAESTSYYYDGISGTPTDFAYNERMAVLGRFAGNGGIVDNGDGTTTTNGVVAVGQYRPNAFGLYDMIGNVSEATRDCKQINSNSTDPYNVPTPKDLAFGVFGGAWHSEAKLPYVGNSGGGPNLNLNNLYNYVGLRLSFFEGENPFKPAE